LAYVTPFSTSLDALIRSLTGRLPPARTILDAACSADAEANAVFISSSDTQSLAISM
jgi:hypothetical protein